MRQKGTQLVNILQTEHTELYFSALNNVGMIIIYVILYSATKRWTEKFSLTNNDF